MRFKSFFYLIIFSLFLAGCAANHPKMSREEYLSTTQHTYDNSPDEIFKASEKLFNLADGNDFQYSWTDDTLIANRKWSFYLVLAAGFGNDTWQIKTQKLSDGKTKVSVMVSTTSSSLMPMPTTGGDFSGGTTPSMANLVQGTAIYDIYWSRLDYLLGINKHWMTCKEADQKVKDKKVWGNNEALCNSLNMDDKLPEGYVSN